MDPQASATLSTSTQAFLTQAWSHAAARWPDVELGLESFSAHAAPSIDATAAEARDKLHTDDLYLACACLHGVPGALRRFERDTLGGADDAVRGLDPAPAFLDEVRQRLRTKLLTGDTERGPRIAEYAGRGALVAWVTVAAVRTGLSLLRETKRAEKYAGDGWAEALALPELGDVELDYVKQRYREQFARALVETCHGLPPRDRTVLRMHFVDGLNIDQIGVVYGVHRATVARWIAKSRTALLEGTRTYLCDRLAVPTSEFASLDRLVRSQLDVSLGALFPEVDESDVAQDAP